MNKVIVVLYTVVLLCLSFWLGEAGKGLAQILPYAFAPIGMAVIPYLFFKKWTYRIVIGFLFIIMYGAAFYLGNLSFYKAYNSCLEDAEQIRATLSEYKTENGKYPDRLDDLNRPLPCSRCLRGTILEYESTALNYRIWFKDWLVEHEATDKKPFVAHK